ncbi:MAG: hypothetical protein U1F11_12585 [Steroidobacteraceae bacterium]
MRIAKPVLLTITPIGVGWGLVEAGRFHWWLAVLMAAMLTVVATLTGLTVRRIRTERVAARGAASAPGPPPPPAAG